MRSCTFSNCASTATWGNAVTMRYAGNATLVMTRNKFIETNSSGLPVVCFVSPSHGRRLHCCMHSACSPWSHCRCLPAAACAGSLGSHPDGHSARRHHACTSDPSLPPASCCARRRTRAHRSRTLRSPAEATAASGPLGCRRCLRNAPTSRCSSDAAPLPRPPYPTPASLRAHVRPAPRTCRPGVPCPTYKLVSCGARDMAASSFGCARAPVPTPPVRDRPEGAGQA